MKTTTIISLYAGPGSGKSTSAAYIYALLKDKGLNVELVREYVKDWAWEGRQIGTYDQVYFLGKQVRREAMLLGKVELIITDSPVWMCSYYAMRYAPPYVRHGIESLVKAYYDQSNIDGHDHFSVWVNRSKPYSHHGRFENEEQAKKVDIEMRGFLDGRGVDLLDSNTDLDSLRLLSDNIETRVYE